MNHKYFCFTCFDYQLPGLMIMGYDPITEVEEGYWRRTNEESFPIMCNRCKEFRASFFLILRDLESIQ